MFMSKVNHTMRDEILELSRANNFYVDMMNELLMNDDSLKKYMLVYVRSNQNNKLLAFGLYTYYPEALLLCFLLVDKNFRRKSYASGIIIFICHESEKIFGRNNVLVEVDDNLALKYFIKHDFKFIGKTDCKKYLVLHKTN